MKKVFKISFLKSPKSFRKFQVIFNSILAIIARVKQKSNFKHYLCIFRGHTPYLYQLSSIVVLTKVINYPHNTSREIVLRHTLTTYLCLVLTKWGHKLRRMDACFRRITWDMSKVIHHKYYKNSNSCTFALIWADWAVRAGLKIIAILVKYSTFETCFFRFSCAKQLQN